MLSKKPIIFLISLTLLVLFSLSAHGSPKIVIIPEEYQFGQITEGETVTHRFTIENRGDSDLIINDVRPG
jgi:hypothetical protein